MPLTDTALKNLKATGKIHKHADGGGLYIHVSPTGGKLWRLFYRFGGKAKLLSFGIYPTVTLKMARDLRDQAKALLARGIDPSEHKKAALRHEQELANNTFEAIAREWHAKFSERWEPKNAKKILTRMEKDIFPFIGFLPITDIKPKELLTTVRRIEARGAVEYAHRTMQYCGKVFRYAIATDRAERDISADLRGAIPPPKTKHYATILDPKKVCQLLRAIDSYEGHFMVSCALKLAPLTFVRPGELRGAEWAEFDLDKAEWRIPAKRMKMNEQHIVPLAHQTLEILQALHEVTGHGKFLFPSVRTDERPMSDNTVNAALRRMGYAKEEMTGHGFRSMASTLLNEQGWNRDAIERQLAHAERNKVRASYNFAEFLPERRKMMAAWADYLDELRNDA